MIDAGLLNRLQTPNSVCLDCLEHQGPGNAWCTGHSLNICVRKEVKEGREGGRERGSRRKKKGSRKEVVSEKCYKGFL